MDTKLAIETILKANSKELEEAFKNSGKSAQGLGKKISKVMEEGESKFHKFKEGFKEAFNFGTAASMGAKVGDAIFDVVKDAAKALPEFTEKMDAIGKTAQTIGIGTTAFQELGYAAKIADVPAETFEKNLKKLTIGMGQLKVGTGNLFTGMKKLNPVLTTQLMHAKDSKEAFFLVAEAIKKSTSASQRAAIATAAFGKAGVDMLPMLMGGREELEKMTKEAHIYGSVMDDRAIASSAEFADSMKRVNGVISNQVNKAMGSLAETMAPLLSGFAEWLGKNQQLIPVLGWIAAGIAALVGTILLVAAAQWLWNAAAAANPITWIVLGIVALVAGIVLLIANWKSVSNFMVNSVAPAFMKIGQTIMAFVLAPVNMVVGAIISLLRIAQNIPGIGGMFKSAADGAQKMQDAMNSTMTGTTETGGAGLGQIWKGKDGKDGGTAPNSSALKAGSTHVTVPVTVNNERAPGTRSTVHAAPALAGFSQGANY